MQQNNISVIGLSKNYKIGDEILPVLDNLTLEIPQGDFISVVGESGSGKSTLMNIIGGLDTPDSGRVLINGTSLLELNQKELCHYRNKKIGFIFQSFNLDGNMSAIENVIMPLMYAGVPRKKRIDLAKNALERVGLQDRIKHLPSQLSGGQRQRVSIARAIVNSPSILLADEPCGNLDTKTSVIIMDMLGELNMEGYTVIMVTHNRAQAQNGKKIIEIIDGHSNAVEKV